MKAIWVIRTDAEVNADYPRSDRAYIVGLQRSHVDALIGIAENLKRQLRDRERERSAIADQVEVGSPKIPDHWDPQPGSDMVGDTLQMLIERSIKVAAKGLRIPKRRRWVSWIYFLVLALIGAAATFGVILASSSEIRSRLIGRAEGVADKKVASDSRAGEPLADVVESMSTYDEVIQYVRRTFPLGSASPGQIPTLLSIWKLVNERQCAGTEDDQRAARRQLISRMVEHNSPDLIDFMKGLASTDNDDRIRQMAETFLQRMDLILGR